MLRLGIRLGARLGWVVIALAVALPALADDLQEAQALVKAGQHRQALALVDKVLASNPRDANARFLKGVILTEQGKAKEAIDIFTRLTQDRPELPEPYNNLAVIYASQGQYDKARAALEQSIRTHPSYATAYENLGDVYAKLASQAYDKALQLDSSNAAAKNKLSLVRELTGRPSPTVVATAPKETPKAPAKEPAKPAPAADVSDEVLKAVNGWAAAWSNKDADGYLSYYARDFKTPGGEPREAWEKTRRARIEAPKSISVSLASPKVTMSGADRATVTFRQTYKSDRLNSNSSKTLVMVKSDGGWKILEEKSG
jgi:tetratricopeptide (TPR) repeat protein